jgi:hypothetical protein
MNKQGNNQAEREYTIEMIIDEVIFYYSPMNVHWFQV